MILGHDAQIQFFKEKMQSPFFHHAWLLKGPKGVGKFSCAVEFSHDILKENYISNCKIIASQDQQSIPVDVVRHSLDFLTQTTIEGGWKILIIDSMGDLNRHSQNALLKILEEPRPKTLFLLILHDGGKVLPTIMSRTIPLHFPSLKKDSVLKYIQQNHSTLTSPKTYVELALGSIGRLETLIQKQGVILYQTLVNSMIEHKFVSIAQLATKHDPLFLGEMITLIYHRCILANEHQLDVLIYEKEKEDLSMIFNMLDWRKSGSLFTRIHMAQNLHLESSMAFID